MMKNDPQPSIFRKESLERLSSPEQLDQLMQVVNSRSWLSLAALGAFVGLTVAWSIVGRIPIVVMGRGVLVHPTDSSNRLVGLVYLEGNAGDRVQPGMEVMLIPDRMGSEAIGGILGRVKTISAAPVTTLDDARRATATSLERESIEVIAELEQDASTTSGYRWSSPAGQRMALSPGMSATAHVTLARKAPITFAFPFLQ